MSSASVHDEWLSLIEISGPFLAIPVLKEVFPQGLDELDGSRRKRLRQAYEEWREALETDDPQFLELHAAWIDEVLSRGLELDEDRTGDVLKQGDRVPTNLRVTSPEHGVTLAPDLAVVDSSHGDKSLMIIQTYAADVDLEATMKHDGWAASPVERMVQLCRLTGCRNGLVTNGERWMLVDAPVGAVTTFASWYARIWSQEPITLQAFVHLLGIRRFFFDESEQLPTLFDRSLKHQDEVTEALGEQVRRAVEVLIQSLDKADLDRNRELLRDVAPAELYEAGLTVMMRLVFLLSAEERGLLLLGDERYEANYALSTLRMKLRTESEEILERRWDAWSRLLAIFRAVFGGVEHENLHLPALGGSLFDPDRFPLLEGRPKGSRWLINAAKPLPIDNRTVLLLLEAIQQFQGRTLSYRALDVEQIGYVYEGLLERTVKRTDEVTLELDATKSAKTPWVKLVELESADLDGDDRLIELLLERSGSSTNRVRNDLAKPVDDELADRLLTACQGDLALRDCIKPYANLLRTDPWGYPLVYPKGAFIVTTGSDRRETGTHYTPKSLTETIVTETLTPVAYVGPAEGKPRNEWVLKPSAELLDLKICDPAMGSGAFLVQACRWLAERLVEAWSQEEASGKYLSINGEVLDDGSGKDRLPRDAESQTVIARRLIAERCLCGVDLNPLAVELAKLSIWLVTLSKDRPFGFLDHNLHCGDSLLGIHRLDQITELTMNPGRTNTQLRVFGRNIEQAVREAIELRQRLRETPIRDIHDVEAMTRLNADALRRIEVPKRIADGFIGNVFAADNPSALESRLAALAIQADHAVQGDRDALQALAQQASGDLAKDTFGGHARRPFHWPLEFPEVFARERPSFDAIVGNPPFLGGKRISGVAGTAYRDWLLSVIAEGRRGSADLVAYFFLRAYSLLREGGGFGLLAVNTIAEGDTRQVGLEAMIRAGALIHAAYPNEPWPGSAAVVTSRVHVHKGKWSGLRSLMGAPVPYISAFLSDHEESSPKCLKVNEGIAFIGSYVLGLGFMLTHDEAQRMLDADPRNAEVIFPYLNGEDLNSDPDQRSSRWVINFWDWPEERARTYSLPYEWVLQRVKPERQRRNDKGEFVLRKPLPRRWWHYADKRPALYHAIGRGHHFEHHPEGWNHDMNSMEYVLVLPRVSKFLICAPLKNTPVFSDQTVVFALSDAASFALLQSSIHDAWTRRQASSLETRLRYTPTDVFETFPRPLKNMELSLQPGKRLEAAMAQFASNERQGLTSLYNRLHEREERDPLIDELRELHREVDLAVARAYGWDDLDLGHGFHEVPYLSGYDRVRFTISEPARLEVLLRLSKLNRQRYEEEVAQGLYNSTARIRTSRTKRTRDEPTPQDELDFGETPATPPPPVAARADATRMILNYLRAHPGYHDKDAILKGAGFQNRRWNVAIDALLADGSVEQQGEHRSARYRATATAGAEE